MGLSNFDGEKERAKVRGKREEGRRKNVMGKGGRHAEEDELDFSLDDLFPSTSTCVCWEGRALAQGERDMRKKSASKYQT